MKSQLKRFIKTRPLLLKLSLNLRDGYLFKKSVKKILRGKSNMIKIHSSVRFVDSEIKIIGKNNSIQIAEGAFFKNVTFLLLGNNHRVLIGNNVSFNRGGSIWMDDENCVLEIGECSTFEEVHIAVTETNSKVKIGNDCMFANGIEVRTGDSHSILDAATLERINYAKDVNIGNQVWVGAHVSILKGVNLASHSVVATRALVTKSFEQEGVLIGGFPAKVLKENIKWDRSRIRPSDNNNQQT